MDMIHGIEGDMTEQWDRNDMNIAEDYGPEQPTD
jgi:hypothetical protein